MVSGIGRQSVKSRHGGRWRNSQTSNGPIPHARRTLTGKCAPLLKKSVHLERSRSHRSSSTGTPFDSQDLWTTCDKGCG